MEGRPPGPPACAGPNIPGACRHPAGDHQPSLWHGGRTPATQLPIIIEEVRTSITDHSATVFFSCDGKRYRQEVSYPYPNTEADYLLQLEPNQTIEPHTDLWDKINARDHEPELFSWPISSFEI